MRNHININLIFFNIDHLWNVSSTHIVKKKHFRNKRHFDKKEDKPFAAGALDHQTSDFFDSSFL